MRFYLTLARRCSLRRPPTRRKCCAMSDLTRSVKRGHDLPGSKRLRGEHAVYRNFPTRLVEKPELNVAAFCQASLPPSCAHRVIKVCPFVCVFLELLPNMSTSRYGRHRGRRNSWLRGRSCGHDSMRGRAIGEATAGHSAPRSSQPIITRTLRTSVIAPRSSPSPMPYGSILSFTGVGRDATLFP